MGKDNNNLRLIKTDNPYIKIVQLVLNGKKRQIGFIDETGEGTFKTDRDERHLLRVSTSLGFNLALLLTESIPFHWIVIDYCGEKLVTSRKYFLANGSIHHFKKAGCEPQCFLRLTEFGLQKARDFENNQLRPPAKTDLFGEAV